MKTEDLAFAWVRNKTILHAGFVMGKGPDEEVWLVGKGLKGYPDHGVWVPIAELVPLAETKGFSRQPQSLTEVKKRLVKHMDKVMNRRKRK